MFKGKLSHIENIWKITHKPLNPTENPLKKADKYGFVKVEDALTPCEISSSEEINVPKRLYWFIFNRWITRERIAEKITVYEHTSNIELVEDVTALESTENMLVLFCEFDDILSLGL